MIVSMSFTKPVVAMIKPAIAELYTHSTMSNLLERYGFTLCEEPNLTNKLNRASSYLDHCDWTNRQIVKQALEMLTEIYFEHKHFLEIPDDPSMMSNAIFSFKRMVRTLESIGIKWNGNRLIMPGQISISKLPDPFNLDSIKIEMDRASDNVESDPSDALTACEGILSSTCKAILEKENVQYGNNPSLHALVTSVMGKIGILPDDISEKVKGGLAAKKIFGSISGASQGLGELKNLYGDSHGKPPDFKGIQPRHARLMVHLAGGLAIFLMETYLEKNN